MKAFPGKLAKTPATRWLGLVLAASVVISLPLLLDRQAKNSPNLEPQAVLAESQPKRDAETWDSLLQAVQNAPENSEAWMALGDALWDRGHVQEAGQCYQQSQDAGGNHARCLGRLGTLQKTLGYSAQAIHLYRLALKEDAQQVEVANALAWLLATDADSRLRQPLEALRLAEQVCLSTDRREARYLDTLAAAYAANGRFAEAMATLEEALGKLSGLDRRLATEFRARASFMREAPPTWPSMIRWLSNTLQCGDRPEAVDAVLDLYVEQARRLPEGREELDQLAWILATASEPELRDGGIALRLSRAVCDAEPSAKFLATLAAAYGEAGEFDVAQSVADERLQAALQSGDATLAERLRTQLDTYRRGLPVRVPTSHGLAEVSSEVNDDRWLRLALAHCEVAVWLAEHERWHAVEQAYRQALAFEPTLEQAWRGLAQLMLEQGRFDAAAAHLSRALLLNREDAESLVALGTLRKAQGRTTAALKAYRDALELRPEWSRVENSLAWLLATQGSSQEELKEALTRAEQLCERHQRGDATCLDTLAVAQAALGQFDAAEACLVEAIALVETEAEGTEQQLLDFKLRLELFRIGRPFVTVEQAHRDLGDYCGALKRQLEAAAGHYRNVLEVRPGDVELLVKLGTVLKEQGDTAGCRNAYQAALELNPDLREVSNALAWNFATCQEESLRDSEQALAIAERICAAEPNNPRYRDTLAAALAAGGAFDRAVATLDQALELLAEEPDDIRLSLAEAFQARLADYTRRATKQSN